MLQQTFRAFEISFSQENDACIDCAKAVVEVVCQIIVAELDSPLQPGKSNESFPDFGAWVSSAVRALKLGDNRDLRFQKLVSQHHKLTTVLGDLRNAAGPTSHGKDGFLEKLSNHHRQAAVLSADAIVTFLHQAYLETKWDLTKTREPYDRFQNFNTIIDKGVSLNAIIDDEGFLVVDVSLPTGDILPMRIEPSRLLYQIDRAAYIETLNSVQSSPQPPIIEETED